MPVKARDVVLEVVEPEAPRGQLGEPRVDELPEAEQPDPRSPPRSASTWGKKSPSWLASSTSPRGPAGLEGPLDADVDDLLGRVARSGMGR